MLAFKVAICVHSLQPFHLLELLLLFFFEEGIFRIMRQALIHNSTSSASIRDDFSSHGGSTIDLGYFKVVSQLRSKQAK